MDILYLISFAIVVILLLYNKLFFNLIIKIFLYPYNWFSTLRRFFLLKYYVYKGAKIGKHTYIGPNVYLDVNHPPGKIVVGKNCYITRNCSILVHSDAFQGGPKAEKEGDTGRLVGDVTIGNNVFIGFHSVILPNVKIGDGAVVGAMSLVNKSVPANTIVGGVPAKVLGNVEDKS